MKQLVKALLGVLVIAAGVSATPAAAQLQFGRMDTGLYLGGSLGGSQFRNACEGVPGGVSCDDKDFALRGFVGWQFNRWFGLELGYADLGKAEASVPGFGVAGDARSVDLVGVASYPFNDLFALYGKAGVARTRLDINSPIGGVRDNSTNLTYGFGARFNFTRNFATRLEWQRYHDVGDENTTGKVKIDYLSIGLLYGFY